MSNLEAHRYLEHVVDMCGQLQEACFYYPNKVIVGVCISLTVG